MEGAEAGSEVSMFCYGGLLYGLNPDVEYMVDEAAFWILRGKDEELEGKVGDFDSDGHRARRHLTRLLLSGSLSKNQDSVLYRSFFRSSMREVHLLPLISKYIVEEKREEKTEEESLSWYIPVKSLCDILQIIFHDCSSVFSLRLTLSSNNQFLCFLPLLLSHLPNIRELRFQSFSGSGYNIDFSLMQQTDISKLEGICLEKCSFDSLSPLSLCDLSSLHVLGVDYYPCVEENSPLNGLSSDITRFLRKYFVTHCDLKDLSPLSDCDLSSLEELDLSDNQYLSDLSPLRYSDFSCLKSLNLSRTNISDFSPLSTCKGLAPEELDFHSTSIEDLSPLSDLNLFRLRKAVDLSYTKVSDLSPLMNVSNDFVVVDIRNTPAAKRLAEQGLTSPHTIGKVKVWWGA